MKRRGLTLVFFTAIISGFAIFLNKFGAKGIDPYLFTGMKNILTAVFLFSIIVFALNTKRLLRLSKKDWLRLSFVGLIGGSIPFLLFFKGLTITSAANAAFIHKSMFVFVALFAFIFLKERLERKHLVAALMLLLGTALLLKLAWSPWGYGDLLIFLAMLFWSVEIVLSKHLLKGLEGIQVAFGRMFFGSLFIIMFLIVTDNYQLSAITTSQLSWAIISSIILLGYVGTFYTGLKHIKASVAAAILLFGSVITTLLTIAYAGKIDVVQGLGVVLLTTGVLTYVGFQNVNLVITRLLRYRRNVSAHYRRP